MIARRVYVCTSDIWEPTIVKIGETGNVPKRMRDLRATPLLVLSGGRRVESEIHRLFASDRIRHEYFRVTGEMFWALSRIREEQRDAGLSTYDMGSTRFLERLGVDPRRQYVWQSSLWSSGPDARTDKVAVAMRAELAHALRT